MTRPGSSSYLRRSITALRSDWSTVDDASVMAVAAGILLVGIWFLLIEGGNRVIGALLVPIALLAVYRTVRALRHRQ